MAARGTPLRSRWRLAAALGLAALAAGARADGFSVAIQPSYVLTSQETKDQLGVVTRRDARTFEQSYRLGYDLSLGSALSFSAGGILDDKRQHRSDQEPANTESTNRGLFGRLNLALPALAGGVGYDLSQALASNATTLTSENTNLFARWSPLGLPDLSLRLGRVHFYDKLRQQVDTTTTSALAAAQYHYEAWEAKYALVWNRPSDDITGTVSSSVDQVAQLLYSDRLFQDRTSIYASATLRNRVVRTLVIGTGDITLQQHPVGGLSLIEGFADSREQDVLALNPALVDGNTTAGAAVDIGYGLAQAGDTRWRDLGVQFADLLTPVNVLRVWVDRKLPDPVAALYEWTVWRSDDNKNWSTVNIARPVTFAPFQNYFEIPVQETAARYLKVVTRPPQLGSTEPAVASVLVTEVQAFQVSSAASTPRLLASSSAAFYLSSTTQLWRPINLAWDLSASLERRLTPTDTLWSLQNGLSASQGIARNLTLGERVARLDGDYGQGHSGKTEWSVGLTWKPLNTFFGSLFYGGQYVDAQPTLDLATGTYYSQIGGLTNTVSSLVRAELYEGISTQVNATGSILNELGRDTYGLTVNSTASFVPNPYVTLALGYLSANGVVIDQEKGRSETSSKRMDATLSLRPASALSLVFSISRTITLPKPYNTGSGQISFSPFRGDLQLSLAYSRSFETASRTSTELFTPNLRWYVRQGLQATVSYTLLNTTTPVSEDRSRTLAFGLTLNL